jgi:glycosyltransferase involved in cell wall biosynthesis
MNVCVAYFGRYGSGRDLAEILFHAGIEQGDNVSLVIGESSGKNRKKFFTNFFRNRSRLLENVTQRNTELVIFPMSSPSDVGLGRKLRKKGIRTARLIHDFTRHPGDLYPPNFLINYLIHDADSIVCLSNYVANQILSYDQQIRLVITSHPYYMPLIDSETKILSSENRRILFIGRGSRYKGLHKLLKVWRKVGGPNNYLTIAGHHKTVGYYPRLNQIKGWLSNESFHKIVATHDVVVLPYIEGSQSGIIPMAHQYGRPVVVSPVGGLPEQIENFKTGIVAVDTTDSALVDALNDAINFEWHLPKVDVGNSHATFYNAFKDLPNGAH